MSISSKVYIILVNWKGWADTLECLESVFRLEHANYEVVVCDNDSGDGSVQRILDWAAGRHPTVHAQNPALEHLVSPNIAKPIRVQLLDGEQALNAAPASESVSGSKLTVIQTGGNLGFAGGNNVGIRYAQSRGDMDYVWLLNNDTVVDSKALTYLLERSLDAKRAVVVGSTLIFYGLENTLQAAGCATYSPSKALASPLLTGRPVNELNELACKTVEENAAYVVGASMLVPLPFLERVGLMQEDYFLYFEELDWAVRGQREGFKPAFAYKSMVFHKVGASTGSGGMARLSVAEKLSYLNRVLVTKRFYPNWMLWVRLRICAEGFRALFRGARKEALFAIRVAFDCADRPRTSSKP